LVIINGAISVSLLLLPVLDTTIQENGRTKFVEIKHQNHQHDNKTTEDNGREGVEQDVVHDGKRMSRDPGLVLVALFGSESKQQLDLASY